MSGQDLFSFYGEKLSLSEEELKEILRPGYCWKEVLANVAEVMTEGRRVVLAISGGVDSMSLLNIMQRNFPGSFVVAHFVHHIRDENLEEPMIQEYCKKHNIEMFTGHGVGLKDSSNQEAQARQQRWDFLESVANAEESNGAPVVMTSHHLGDMIENFLIQTMRGVPVEQTRMVKVNVKNNVVRFKPFLDYPKNMLKQNAIRNKVLWVEDYTNNDTHHDRNFVRNTILPLMKERRNIEKTIPATINTIGEIRSMKELIEEADLNMEQIRNFHM